MILDTNALSAFVDGERKLKPVLNKAEELYIPLIVLGEFRYGVLRSARKREYEEWLKNQLKLFQILHLSENTTIQYAKIRLELRENGTPIPENDIWIASLSREHSLPVITRDKHFSYIKNLIVEAF